MSESVSAANTRSGEALMTRAARLVQPRRPVRKPGSVGRPIEGVEFKLIDDEWVEVGEGEIGEIAIKGHNVMKGLPEQARGHGSGHPRRLVPHRRPGPPRRGRLLLHRRPGQGHDPPRRLQRTPARSTRCSTSTPRWPPRRSSASHMPSTARRSPPPSCSTRAPRSPRRNSSRRSANASRPTNTRASCGSLTGCPWARPARSSSARSKSHLP